MNDIEEAEFAYTCARLAYEDADRMVDAAHQNFDAAADALDDAEQQLRIAKAGS